MAKWVLRRWHEAVMWARGLRGGTWRMVVFAKRRAREREATFVCRMLSLCLSP